VELNFTEIELMKTIFGGIAGLVLAGALCAPAMAEDATIHIHGSSVGFVVGVGGAHGYVKFQGKRYPINVSGLSVGTIGANSYDLDGAVLHVTNIADIEGTYAAAEAGATAGGGAGGVDMTNGKGVEIRATSTTSGLKLTLGASGVTIHLAHD
jgi:hypothetical protein